MTQAPATPELVERLNDAAERHPGPPDGINRLLKQAADALEAQQRELNGRRAQLDEVEQIAGRFLGYPWFKDDQKNFPGATEADGVCIGEHVAETIVEELRAKAEAQQARIAELEAELADAAIPSPYCEICGSCGSEGCGCEHKCKYAHSHPDVVRDMDALQALADRYEKALRAAERLARSGEHEHTRLLDIRDLVIEALSSQGRHEGGEVGLPELPCGVGPSDLTDPQSQHPDGEDA